VPVKVKNFQIKPKVKNFYQKIRAVKIFNNLRFLVSGLKIFRPQGCASSSLASGNTENKGIGKMLLADPFLFCT
jgi:hypothetical protein